MEKEYKRSLEDEIDWKLIDQLHNSTLNFSSKSLEIKKILFVLLGIVVPTIIKLENDKLSWSLFFTLYVIVIAFWFLDSFTYYYQEKLREKMNEKFLKIKERNKEMKFITNNNECNYTIENTRTEDRRLYRSVFNNSLAIYPVLLVLNTICSFLYWKEIIC